MNTMNAVRGTDSGYEQKGEGVGVAEASRISFSFN